MPAVSFDPTDALLRLGVEGPRLIAVVMPFDIGGAGIVTNEQPFDIEAPYVGVTNVQPFDISGNVRANNVQPFDVGEVTGAYSIQPFDIIALTPNPTPGTPQPQPAIAFTTTLAVPTVPGSNTITVVSAAGITTGTVIYLQGNPPITLLVTNVAGNVLTVI